MAATGDTLDNTTPNRPEYKLRVELNRTDGVYQCGRNLQGTVCLDLEKAMSITAVQLRLYGSCYVRWSEEKKVDDAMTEVEHTAEEIYIDDKFTLWGQVSGGVEELLPAGRHLFPFCVRLLENAPCSFEGRRGHVRYYVEARVHLPQNPPPSRPLTPASKLTSNSTLNSTTEAGSLMTSRPATPNMSPPPLITRRVFTLLRDHILDLEKGEDLTGSLREENDMTATSTCCYVGRFSCLLAVPRARCVPGERLTVEVVLANVATRKAKATSLVLRQIVTFGAREPAGKGIREVMDVVRVQGEKTKPPPPPPNPRRRNHLLRKLPTLPEWSDVGRSSRQEWTSSAITVPPLPPSTLATCKFIDIRYELALEMGSSQKMVVSVPIIIGNIPLRDLLFPSWTYQPQFKPSDESNKEGSLPAPPPSPLQSESVHSLPPDQSCYVPSYRVYRMASPPVNTTALDCSPGQRRKARAFYLAQATHHESVV